MRKFIKNKLSKKALVILTIFLCIVIILISLRYAIFKDNSSDISGNHADLKNKDIIISPKGRNDKNPVAVDRIIYNNSLKLTTKMENQAENWQDILEAFCFNQALAENNAKLENKNLEILTDKIKRVPPVFQIGNVNELVNEYGDLIKDMCNFYKIDWRLILAIVHQESLFNPNAVSRAGAFGLMQIMPRTGAGLQNELQLEDTKTPKNNLTAGIYYYATLVSNFEFAGDEKFKFALAAYNAGLGRVVDAMTITYYFKKDYRVWDNVKEYYPYLASNQDSVHSLVWPVYKRPPAGILNNWKEPYYYVEYIMYYYGEYKKYFKSNLIEEKPKKKNKKKK